MKRERGMARCGLACCLCSEDCAGCKSEECHDREWCENRKCTIEKGIDGCYACDKSECRANMLGKIKPYGFTLFIRRYGIEKLMDCLEKNEKAGVVYHRQGVMGDYDDFTDVEELIQFILKGK